MLGGTSIFSQSPSPAVGIATHSIPMFGSLWQIENYRDFLAVHRDRLAQTANSFLNSLLVGDIPEAKATDSILGTSS